MFPTEHPRELSGNIEYNRKCSIKLINCQNRDESSLKITLLISRNTLNTNYVGHNFILEKSAVKLNSSKKMRNFKLLFIKNGEFNRSRKMALEVLGDYSLAPLPL